MSDTPRSWFFFKGRTGGPPAVSKATKPPTQAPAPRAPESLDDCVRRLLRERAAAAPPPTPHQIEKQLAREREAEARREEDRAAAMREAMAMALVRDRMWDPRDPPEFEALRRPRWWPRSWRW